MRRADNEIEMNGQRDARSRKATNFAQLRHGRRRTAILLPRPIENGVNDY